MRIMLPRSEQLQDQRPRSRFDPLWEWGDAQEKGYLTIKILLTCDPILRLPDPEKTFVLRTGASDYRIVAVLMQEHGS